MPAGVSWPKYIKFGVAASISMFLGAQSVHLVYRPLDDLPELIETAKIDKQNPLDGKQARTSKEPKS